MILPISFLWSQLNGPQVAGISTAIFEYWKSIFDDKLDYFNTFSVETANDQHLTLLGLLSGLVRPTISEADRDYFYFTDNPEVGSNHGFADLEDRTKGGRLTSLNVGQGVHNVSLNEAHYRSLLKAFINGEGELGSLELLDDICYELTKLDLGAVEPFYRFVFMYGDDIPSERAQGDVFLDVGDLSQWNNPMHIYAVLKGVAESIYAPQPQLYISISTTGSCALPAVEPQSSIYEEPITVSMFCVTSGSTIYYTLDGSTPTASSNVYQEPFTLSESAVVKAIAMAKDFGNSQVTSRVYTIQ